VVTAATLDQYGYRYWEWPWLHFILPDGTDGGTSRVRLLRRKAGLTFCFLDGCSTAPFLDTLMINK